MFAKIYQPAPSSMTSGRAKSKYWIIEFTGGETGEIDPLTGNVRSVDMRSQIELKFETLEEALEYAKDNNIPHRVVQAKSVKRIPRSYSDNFGFDRKLPWTH